MTGDLREVLQYVPLFAGKVFVVVFDEGLLPEAAVAETLLDLIALQRIGVQLVVVVVGGDLADSRQLGGGVRVQGGDGGEAFGRQGMHRMNAGAFAARAGGDGGWSREPGACRGRWASWPRRCRLPS